MIEFLAIKIRRIQMKKRNNYRAGSLSMSMQSNPEQMPTRNVKPMQTGTPLSKPASARKPTRRPPPKPMADSSQRPSMPTPRRRPTMPKFERPSRPARPTRRPPQRPVMERPERPVRARPQRPVMERPERTRRAEGGMMDFKSIYDMEKKSGK